jgi:hypothetical protein
MKPHFKSAAAAEEWIVRPGEVTGEIRLCREWHAQGNSVNRHQSLMSSHMLTLVPQGPVEKMLPSEDMIKTCERFKASTKALRDLGYLSHQVNEALRLLDPHFHSLLLQLQKKTATLAFSQAMAGVDGLLLNAREMLFNKMSAPHVDGNDPQLGWAVLVALGDFRGGDFSAPQLGITTRFLPGDMVMVRGRVVQHKTGPFQGQRISLPHFTHSSIWKSFDMLHLVSI